MNPMIAKRLEKEKIENQKPGEYFFVQPLENDMFTWHFTIKGIPGSNYENGLYHGHFLLPKDYPLNPPDIYFQNKNGRFEPVKKICLNITGYHKEAWSPIWSLKKMMEAICAYFVVDEWGIGAVVMTPAERKAIAKTSRDHKCPQCGALTDIEKKINASQVVEKKPDVVVTQDLPVEEKGKGKKITPKKAETVKIAEDLKKKEINIKVADQKGKRVKTK